MNTLTLFILVVWGIIVVVAAYSTMVFDAHHTTCRKALILVTGLMAGYVVIASFIDLIGRL